jgi:hypothetical protein
MMAVPHVVKDISFHLEPKTPNPARGFGNHVSQTLLVLGNVANNRKLSLVQMSTLALIFIPFLGSMQMSPHANVYLVTSRYRK